MVAEVLRRAGVKPELVDEVIFLEEGQISFQKKIELLKEETGETKLSKAIAKVMGYKEHEETI